jgi:peptidoglycan LD-endopeptidase LytH
MTFPKLPAYSADLYVPVVEHPGPFAVLDLTDSYDADAIRTVGWAIGRYDERRRGGMYVSEIYSDGRDHHMGLDIWAPEGTPVLAFADGVIYAADDNDHPRDYGPTVVTEHVSEGVVFWALWGHLSRESLNLRDIGTRFSGGDVIGYMGDEDVNGGWAPHLHLQLSVIPPKGANMPGVVGQHERTDALKIYPDPRAVLGPLY